MTFEGRISWETLEDCRDSVLWIIAEWVLWVPAISVFILNYCTCAANISCKFSKRCNTLCSKLFIFRANVCYVDLICIMLPPVVCMYIYVTLVSYFYAKLGWKIEKTGEFLFKTRKRFDQKLHSTPLKIPPPPKKIKYEWVEINFQVGKWKVMVCEWLKTAFTDTFQVRTEPWM